MQWLSENGFFALLFVAFVAMHLFGHGHGGHGGHGGRWGGPSARSRDDAGPADSLGQEGVPVARSEAHVTTHPEVIE